MSRSSTSVVASIRQKAFWRRAALFFALWLILLPSFQWYDLLIGLGFTLGAALSSMALLPATESRMRLWPLLLDLPRFVLQSVLAGWDIARRVFQPQILLSPGLIEHSTRLEQGVARNTFASLSSLTPGTLACGTKENAIIYHVLDSRQDNAGQLQQEERRMDKALNGEASRT
ncbi:MAG: Na+/H+ antiporter subunit E [Pseudomonadota bacterium]